MIQICGHDSRICLRPLRGVTSVARLERISGRHIVTTSAADGVGKRVAAQGFPMRVFDPSKERLKQYELSGPTET